MAGVPELRAGLKKARKGIRSIAILMGLFAFVSFQQEASLDRAKDLLASLSAEKAGKLVQPFDETRFDWAFTPGARKGLSLKTLSKEEQRRVMDLLKSSLSESGFKKIEDIRSLEAVLRELERNPGRDESLYYVTVYGQPSDREPWAWRWEGHHVSLNFTYRNGQIVSTTPQFLGSNPAEVRSGPLAGSRVLAREEALGRSLMLSFDEPTRKKALIGASAPADIISSNARKASILESLGLNYAEMSPDQKKALRRLVEVHNEVQRSDKARARLEKIEAAGWDRVKFAWMGSLEPGEGHYYRIQGPGFLIEYDNTQNGANHIHTVWRDFEGDFGRDVLAEHYSSSNHHRK